MIVVSDTSPITNLAGIGQLDLLRQLYSRVTIPLAVYNEMVSVGKNVPGSMEVQSLNWIQTSVVKNTQSIADIQSNQTNIDLGEAEAIILTIQMGADLLLMDERRGRAVAVNCGLKVVGILGILLQAKHDGLILLVQPLLDQLVKKLDFRVSRKLYEAILQTAGE